MARELQGAPGGTLRIQVVARASGQEFSSFHLDLSSGDALIGPPDLLRGSNLLEYAGITPIQFPVYPITQHLAEKLHAYTLPRSQENTRVKDLIDLVIIATIESIATDRLSASIESTFSVRNTHPVPGNLPTPPLSWAPSFAAVAATVNLSVANMHDGHMVAAHFWDPVLSGVMARAVWNPHTEGWVVPHDADGASDHRSEKDQEDVFGACE
jgi:hypothetical protein